MTFKEELEVLLRDELRALKRLKSLSFDKTELIIENDIEGLDTILKEEEDLVKVVIVLEKKRIKLLDNWGVQIDTPISNVIQRVPGEKEDLKKIRDELSGVLTELDERNKTNEELVRDNLDWIDFNMNLMTSTQTPSGYGKDSEEKDSSGDINIFDRKV